MCWSARARARWAARRGGGSTARCVRSTRAWPGTAGACWCWRATGDERETIAALAEELDAGAVYWNRRYDGIARETDGALKRSLKEAGIEAESFNGALLREPWELQTGSGGAFQVFTAYWRAALKSGDVSVPLAEPSTWRFTRCRPRSRAAR